MGTIAASLSPLSPIPAEPEGEPKRQTRTRILKHEARWKGPRGRAGKEQDSEPVQGAERREQRERRTRNSEASRRALGSRCQGTGWERENSLILRT